MDEMQVLMSEYLAGMLAFHDGFHWSILNDEQSPGWFAACYEMYSHESVYAQYREMGKMPGDQS